MALAALAAAWPTVVATPAGAQAPTPPPPKADGGPRIVRIAPPPAGSGEAARVLQAAIEAAAPGTVLVLAPGTYRLAAPLRLKSGLTYRGEAGAVLTPAAGGPDFLIEGNGLEGVTIEGLTLDGGGLILREPSRAVAIRSNVFSNIQRPKAAFGHDSAIFVTDVLAGGVIARNRFVDIGSRLTRDTEPSANGVLAYHLADTRIDENHFERVYQAISVKFEGREGTGRGVRIVGNVVLEAGRMGIEMQGNGATGVLIERNYVRMRNRGNEDIAISAVGNRSHDARVIGNTVIRDTPYSEDCAGMGIEAAGVNTTVAGNRVYGHWCASIGLYSDATEYVFVHDNSVCGYRAQWTPISFYAGQGRSVAPTRNRIEADCPAQLPEPPALDVPMPRGG